MEELTQFVTKSFEDKIREKCSEKRDSQVTEDKKEIDVVSTQVENSNCEETATDLSIVNVDVDVCSSQPQTPQGGLNLTFESGRTGKILQAFINIPFETGRVRNTYMRLFNFTQLSFRNRYDYILFSKQVRLEKNVYAIA